MFKITAQGQDGSKREVSFDYYPDYCPVCHTAAEIKRDLAGYLIPQDENNLHRYLQIIFRCPRLSCGNHFIVTYEAPRNRERFAARYPYLDSFYKTRISPNIPKELDIPKGVSKISPRFVTIANQANVAELHSLHDIAGMGYRKALEFLIKDYCITLTQDKDKQATIKTTDLSTCISTYVTNDNVKACAKLATWLGNDETHYERRWTDHDIEDLKRLLRLTQNWIDNELLTAHYVAEMDSKSKAT